MVGYNLLQETLWFIFISIRKNIWKDIKNLLLQYYIIIVFILKNYTV